MATAPTTAAVEKKPKAARKPAAPKAAYFILQVLDEGGQAMEFPKSRVKIVSVERSADRVLEVVEGGNHPNAFYLRGMLPVGRGISPA